MALYPARSSLLPRCSTFLSSSSEYSARLTQAQEFRPSMQPHPSFLVVPCSCDIRGRTACMPYVEQKLYARYACNMVSDAHALCMQYVGRRVYTEYASCNFSAGRA